MKGLGANKLEFWIIVIIAASLILALFYFVAQVEAAARTDGEFVSLETDIDPPYLARWLDEDCDLVCYAWKDGSGDCYPCEGECGVRMESTSTNVPNSTETKVAPTATPVPTDIPTSVPTLEPTPEPTEKEMTFCHCEQGEGEGAEGRKNCHPAKYNHGHSQHEWDYWSEDGTCDGWHH